MSKYFPVFTQSVFYCFCSKILVAKTYRRKSFECHRILISALLFHCIYCRPHPKNPFPQPFQGGKKLIAKHELIHNFSKCSGLTTTCNPAAQAARISSTYPNRVGLTTFPFQTYKGSLNFPHFGLFFNLGLLGERCGLGFGTIVLWAFSRFTASHFQWFFFFGAVGVEGAAAGIEPGCPQRTKRTRPAPPTPTFHTWS